VLVKYYYVISFQKENIQLKRKTKYLVQFRKDVLLTEAHEMSICISKVILFTSFFTPVLSHTVPSCKRQWYATIICQNLETLQQQPSSLQSLNESYQHNFQES